MEKFKTTLDLDTLDINSASTYSYEQYLIERKEKLNESLVPGYYKGVAANILADTYYFYINTRQELLTVGFREGEDELYYMSFEPNLDSIINYILTTGDTNILQPISANDFYDSYRAVLSQTDEMLNTRGVLIRPDEIEERIEVSELGELSIK